MKETKKLVGIYLRVSSDEQREKQTIKNQELAIQEYLEQHPEYEVYKWYKDDGVSGASELEHSEQGLEMLSDVQDKKFEILIATKIDRLARSSIRFWGLYGILQNHGISLILIQENFDPTTPEGKFFMGIMSAFADYEKAIILARMKATKIRKLKEGNGYIYPSPPNYGYKKVNGKLVIVEERAKIVRQIITWASEGATVPEIMKRLNDKGIPSQRNSKWTKRTIKRIIKAPIYGKGYKINLVTVDGEKKEFITKGLPTIVDAELQDQAISRLSKRGNRGQSAKEKYLLEGLGICEDCGSKIWGIKSYYYKAGTTYIRYKCSNKSVSKVHRSPSWKSCNSSPNSMLRHKCEYQILRQVYLLISNFKTYIWLNERNIHNSLSSKKVGKGLPSLGTITAENDEPVVNVKSEIDTKQTFENLLSEVEEQKLKKNLKKLKDKLDRIKLRKTKLRQIYTEDDHYSKTEFDRENNQLNKQAVDLEAEIAATEATLQNQLNADELQTFFNVYFSKLLNESSVDEPFKNLSWEDKKYVIQNTVSKFYMRDGKITQVVFRINPVNLLRYFKSKSKSSQRHISEEECPSEAIIEEDEKYVIDPENCTECGTCKEMCPSEAIVEED